MSCSIAKLGGFDDIILFEMVGNLIFDKFFSDFTDGGEKAYGSVTIGILSGFTRFMYGDDDTIFPVVREVAMGNYCINEMGDFKNVVEREIFEH